MSYEITGRLIVKLDTIQVSEKFKKKEFVIDVDNEVKGTIYTDTLKFQLTQDKTTLLDKVMYGSEIKVSFNIKGSKWAKEGISYYFSNLEAWKVEVV